MLEDGVESIKRMLGQIRRKQLLVCAYRPNDGDPGADPTLADFTAILNIGSAECLRLAQRLNAKGLIEPVSGGELGSVRLTARGRKLVQRMSRSRAFPDATPAVLPPRATPAPATHEHPTMKSARPQPSGWWLSTSTNEATSINEAPLSVSAIRGLPLRETGGRPHD
jgi:hypothetical protein